MKSMSIDILMYIFSLVFGNVYSDYVFKKLSLVCREWNEVCKKCISRYDICMDADILLCNILINTEFSQDSVFTNWIDSKFKYGMKYLSISISSEPIHQRIIRIICGSKHLKNIEKIKITGSIEIYSIIIRKKISPLYKCFDLSLFSNLKYLDISYSAILYIKNIKSCKYIKNIRVIHANPNKNELIEDGIKEIKKVLKKYNTKLKRVYTLIKTMSEV